MRAPTRWWKEFDYVRSFRCNTSYYNLWEKRTHLLNQYRALYAWHADRRAIKRQNILQLIQTRICAAEMAVRYAALCACREVHVCHCNSLGGAT